MIPRTLLAGGLVLAGLLAAPAADLECRTAPGAGNHGFWYWRLIDGRRCYYPGSALVPKGTLQWRSTVKPSAPKPHPACPTLPAAEVERRLRTCCWPPPGC